MVGGTVIETLDCGDKIWINCKNKNDTCAIYVERTLESRSISEGDTVWWQSGHAYWTPISHVFTDRKLLRIGFSGVSRPMVEV